MRTGLLLLLLNLVAVDAAQSASPLVSMSTYTVLTSSQSDNACQVGSTVCSSTPSWQQAMQQAQSSWGSCQDDVNTFCEGVQVGKGRIEKCLKAHRLKLSKACRAEQKL